MPLSSAPESTPAARLTPADLRWLACPVCHGSLIVNEINNKTPSGSISCTTCTRVYPIVDGLPILLAESATLPS